MNTQKIIAEVEEILSVTATDGPRPYKLDSFDLSTVRHYMRVYGVTSPYKLAAYVDCCNHGF